MLLEQNSLMVEEREREIRQIVQSISDLNEIFRDLGAMIVEQVRGLTFPTWGPCAAVTRSLSGPIRRRIGTPCLPVCMCVRINCVRVRLLFL